MDQIILKKFSDDVTENIDFDEFSELIKKRDILQYDHISFTYEKKKYVLSKSGNSYQIRIDLGKDLYFKKFGNVKIDEIMNNKEEYKNKFQIIKNKEQEIPEFILQFFKNSKIKISI